MKNDRVYGIILSFVLTILISTFAFAINAVNVNTADREQLQTLKGVGTARADAIIAYREAYGPFNSLDDFKKVKGIGDGIIADNQDMIIFQEGASKAANPCATPKDVMSGDRH